MGPAQHAMADVDRTARRYPFDPRQAVGRHRPDSCPAGADPVIIRHAGQAGLRALSQAFKSRWIHRGRPRADFRQARDANLRADLDRCDRDLILRLKHEARERPGYYGVMVGSLDIYQFAIAGAGETLDDLERWKGLVA